MADCSDTTPLPVCAPATTAIDAIAWARALGQSVHLALAGLDDESVSLAVGAVLNVTGDELSAPRRSCLLARGHDDMRQLHMAGVGLLLAGCATATDVGLPDGSTGYSLNCSGETLT